MLLQFIKSVPKRSDLSRKYYFWRFLPVQKSKGRSIQPTSRPRRRNKRVSTRCFSGTVCCLTWTIKLKALLLLLVWLAVKWEVMTVGGSAVVNDIMGPLCLCVFLKKFWCSILLRWIVAQSLRYASFIYQPWSGMVKWRCNFCFWVINKSNSLGWTSLLVVCKTLLCSFLHLY